MPASHSRKSIKRYLRSASRGMRRYQREMGETVKLYEFDKATSTMNDTYDEGPSRRYHRPKLVPVIFFYFREAQDLATDEGHYTVNTAHWTTSVDLMRKAGVTNPLDTDNHFFDRFEFNGFLYRIVSYEKQGFVHGTYLTIAVDGVQVKDDELPIDQTPFYEST